MNSQVGIPVFVKRLAIDMVSRMIQTLVQESQLQFIDLGKAT